MTKDKKQKTAGKIQGKESKKGKETKKSSELKINFNYRKVLGVIIILILIYGAFWYFTKPDFSISDDGIIHYSHSGSVNYEKIPIEETITEKIYKIIFESRGTKIYALLRIPKNQASGSDIKLPGVVILPGAGVSKESETKTPEALSKMGYATLTIDQRDVGETKEHNNETFDPNGDFEKFKNNEEPITYKMIFDVIAAYHLMKQFDEVDSSKVAVIGISNGGRMAIIAAGIDPEINNVIGISAAGYGVSGSTEDEQNKFFKTVDPDNYIRLISPGKVVMIHSENDPGMPYQLAERTFLKAKEPKKFITVSCSEHGYCDEMEAYLEEELKEIFGE